jgi:2-polyprenyl-3-methyl-5-hydroxy-6-metoxy-1,4-benzoquinol methylase
MDACGCGERFASIFDRRVAEKDRARYRRSGPDDTTRLLLGLIAPHDVPGRTVLDVGGGIGVIDLELLRAGAERATLVDGSPAYLDVARAQAREANVLDRIEIVEGDFVRRAGSIDPADIVTLDRVICCYPDVVGLVTAAAGHARRVLGIVVPRDRRLAFIALALENAWMRLRRNPYRAFVHPNRRIDELAADAGLRLAAERRTWFWRVAVYERPTEPA